jgi:prolyl-tRNA synthetase
MGSYGIGPARIMAAAIEQGADEQGIVWPRAISPFDVHLVSLAREAGDETASAAERLYTELEEAGVETIYDDREDAGAGEKLTDAELLGCPLRITVGPRALAEGEVEARARAGGEDERYPVGEAAARAAAALAGHN